MDFAHPDLNRDITAIGGHYRYTREVRLRFAGRLFLVLLGYAVVDTACCGPGGCACAWVPGRIVEWHKAADGSGRAVSRIAPVTDERLRTDLAAEIRRREAVNQVIFLPV